MSVREWEEVQEMLRIVTRHRSLAPPNRILFRRARTQFEKGQQLKRVRIAAGSESLDHPHYMQKWDGAFAL